MDPYMCVNKRNDKKDTVFNEKHIPGHTRVWNLFINFYLKQKYLRILLWVNNNNEYIIYNHIYINIC